MSIYESAVLTDVLKAAEERHRTILDANYSPVDIDAFVVGIKHITEEQQKELSVVLHQHPALLQGGTAFNTSRYKTTIKTFLRHDKLL